jgi:ribosomal protein S18 acetylase RimI-like enzyme
MIVLRPMDPADFETYLEQLIRTYAADHVSGGRWTEAEAPSEARKEVDRILPSGLTTPNQLIHSVVLEPGGEKVGVLWLGIEPRGGFIYDLLIHEAYRRRGYAREAMLLAEKVAVQHGAHKISLHVFATNTGARKLYEQLGYAETNVIMSKPLG